MTQQELGIRGEEKTAKFLTQQGHEILERNYRFKRFEVDIISRKEDVIHFTEVKTRQTGIIGSPALSVTISKQRQILKVANYFMQSRQIDLPSCFNISAIVWNSFRVDMEWIEDAFGHEVV